MALSKGVKKRIWFYGGLLCGIVGFYFYQPIRIDFFAKPVPVPNPPVDPDSRDLFSKGATVLVVTAHPDDSEYYLGPFLLSLAKAGATIDLVVCTDGDKSYYPWQNGGEMRQIRRGEQLAAAKVWHGSNVEFLGFPDGRLHPNSDVIAAIHGRIERYRPGWLITFDGDYPPKVSHGDHRSAGQAAAKAAEGTPVRYEMLFATRVPNYVADTSSFEDQEKSLLALHASEFTGAKLDRVNDTVQNDASDEAENTKFTFGCAFRCVKLN